MAVIGRLSADFVSERAALLLGEVVFGFERGLLDRQAVIDLEMNYLQSGVKLNPTELEIAYLLRDESERVQEILGMVDRAEVEEGRRVWLFLVVEAIYQGGYSSVDALSLVVEVWSTWGHPNELYDIVWPPPERLPSSFAVDQGIVELEKYLAKEGNFFANR